MKKLTLLAIFASNTIFANTLAQIERYQNIKKLPTKQLRE